MHDTMAVNADGRLDEAGSANNAVEPHNAPAEVTKVPLKKSVQKISGATEALPEPALAKKSSVGPKKVVIKKDAANKTLPKPGKKT